LTFTSIHATGKSKLFIIIFENQTQKKGTMSKKREQSESSPLVCRGIRGATTVTSNTKDAILKATQEMLSHLIRENDILPENIVSAYFSTTVDLNAVFPAQAARLLGWTNAALMCGHEMQVPGALERCIRVLIHLNTTRSADEIVHIYLKEAKSLRPDRA
jgi:chorismate mutase